MKLPGMEFIQGIDFVRFNVAHEAIAEMSLYPDAELTPPHPRCGNGGLLIETSVFITHGNIRVQYRHQRRATEYDYENDPTLRRYGIKPVDFEPRVTRLKVL